jgi:hypothetical protein
VIKVERVDGGDFARGYDHVVHGTGAHFVWLNRAKESIAIDLKVREGCAVVRGLAERADVFVQNLAPGAAERLGLGARELRSSYPQLVVANLSGFGTGGPMEQRKAYDMLIQAEAGLISVTGTPRLRSKPASRRQTSPPACTAHPLTFSYPRHSRTAMTRRPNAGVPRCEGKPSPVDAFLGRDTRLTRLFAGDEVGGRICHPINATAVSIRADLAMTFGQSAVVLGPALKAQQPLGRGSG